MSSMSSRPPLPRSLSPSLTAELTRLHPTRTYVDDTGVNTNITDIFHAIDIINKRDIHDEDKIRTNTWRTLTNQPRHRLPPDSTKPHRRPKRTYSPRRRDNRVHHLMLGQKPDCLAHATRDHVGRIREKYGGLNLSPHCGVAQVIILIVLYGAVAQSPSAHAIDFVHRFREIGCLRLLGEGRRREEWPCINQLTIN